MSVAETTQRAGNFTFTVEESDAGARLDAYLAARLPDASRARVRRLIEGGDVLHRERVALKPSLKLRAGDQVEIELGEASLPLAAELTPERIDLDVIYEDDDLVVINKPAGLVVHPGAGVYSGTLANALAYHFSGLSARGGSVRPGLVHRLDRSTSGLIVVAKNEAAHEHLADQFRLRGVEKFYVALAHGAVKVEGGTIDEPIARDPRQRTRMAIVRGGRPALSLYRVRERFGRFTLLDVQIKTGRTHQIRVHLAHVKHPVIGDALYNAGRDQTISDVRLRARVAGLGRQFLHAERLAFKHPRDNREMRFAAPLPGELAEFLDWIRENDF